MAFEAELAFLADRGLTMQNCIEHFGIPTASDPHAACARKDFAESTNKRIAIDEKTCISEGDNGKFVMAWIWVGNEELE